MRTLPFMLVLLISTAVLAETKVAPPANDDLTLRALSDELARFRTVRLSSTDVPYYLSDTIEDSMTFNVSASFGALTERGSSSTRQAQVAVRVGTPAFDNTNFSDPSRFDFMEMFLEHQGSGSMPVIADYDALRHGLWLRFDSAYKKALEKIARKRAWLNVNAAPERLEDFSPAPVVSLILPSITLHPDEERWTEVVKKMSAVFRDQALSVGTAEFSSTAENETFVTSDPIQDRFGDTHVEIEAAAETQAADGMEIKLEYEVEGRTEADLPKDAQLVQAVRDLARRVADVAKAPTLPEDYSGPVLFTGRAAARFFLAALGEPLSHPRDPLGEPEGGRLTDRMGGHIAASLLTVRDDPTQKSWHGHPLLGWYPIDDDGVKPVPITLVDNGVLKTCYMSRIPAKGVTGSNGHSRAGEGSVGNLFITGAHRAKLAALKKQLLKLVKENDLEYGLLVDDVADGSERSLRFSSPFGRGGGGGDVFLPPPVVVYRVFPDGHEELVRGALFKPASFRVLKDIVALGDDPTVTNTDSMGQRVSVIAPSVLVRQLELQRPTHEFQKPPIIPRPLLSETARPDHPGE